MLAYTTVGTNDYAKAQKFYGELFSVIGAKQLLDTGRFTAFGTSMAAPMFGVVKPFNEEPATAGNGQMITIGCKDEDQVQALHAKALELGAACDGEPGLRANGAFYLCYFKDADGNKIAGFCPPSK